MSEERYQVTTNPEGKHTLHRPCAVMDTTNRQTVIECFSFGEACRRAGQLNAQAMRNKLRAAGLSKAQGEAS